MSITVAEEGNRRVGSMSAEEQDQCVMDVVSWFQRHSEDGLRGADRGSVEALRKSLGVDVPEILERLWCEADGGVWFGDKELLSVQRLEKLFADLEGGAGFREGFLPLATDVDGNLLIVDTGSPAMPVFEFDDDGLGDKLAASVVNFMEEQRNNLLSGNFEYIECCGVVEKESGGK
uniref:Knr4/Smi1-like domain-containing protein n=1 Tax=Phaeomonas parva TaxID=124430 RepID=A0A7S1XMT8_9STRA|mmetsp:Transcript_17395/g.53244  ORF Transcript_17395/g.53244 Transcript_17395/m.53244 type:complete len:176 (+) Transcript_17395:115-642(+)|eukprot:CAMPEP_0118885780 /NCGR_PEP_ID=MMETSP1163-20130328/24113_1 /TAXON_ID=124430 /ORGANISM="Phaeomonas parva, Strain CCMP2877" /LENGTH=175 /DNA_ID=CAMNT_0006823847 /DNA_START=81 /DNA_END=608 /DNA_ORIENTATION=-